jgi:hypothetical protein
LDHRGCNDDANNVSPFALIATAHAQPLPQKKVGSCPSGYAQSGGFCAPMRRDAPQ